MSATPRLFGVDYQFLACGDVFTEGLLHAADELGLAYDHGDWRDADLLKRARAFHPDLVFVVHGRRFASRWAKDFEPFRTAVWLLDEPYEVDDTSRFARGFTHIFVNDPATIGCHHQPVYLPVCYDPQLHRPDPVTPRAHSVGFIGGGNSIRNRYLDALAREGLLDYVVGGDWASPAVRAKCVSKNIVPRDAAAWYRATRIVVNVFREQHHFNRAGIPATSMNPRIYEALACGALVISEPRPEIAELVPELPTFRSEAECVALAAQFLTHPAEADALQSACAARLAGHTYAARLLRVLRVAGLRAEVAA